MKKFQKVIKYGAIAFALVLIFGILSSIMIGINSIFSIFNDDGSNDIKDMELIDIDEDINVLDINIDYVDLKIESGEDFRISVSDSKRISYSLESGRLIIEEKSLNVFKDECEIIIYIPNNKVMKSVFIVTGAGIVDIDSINTSKLDLDLGVGSVTIDKLMVSNEANIDTGVGEFIVKDGSINNLEIDMGIGDVSINSAILGNSEINSGVGRLELGLVGKDNDYKLEIDKGLGSIKVDGVSLSDGEVYGNGNNYIDLDGGVGEVIVNFVN